MVSLPSQSDLLTLPDTHIEIYAVRCAQRVTLFLSHAPTKQRQVFTSALLTIQDFTCRDDRKLGEAYNASLNAGMSCPTENPCAFAGAVVCDAARARLIAQLLSEGRGSVVATRRALARTAQVAAHFCVRAFREASATKRTISYVRRVILGDFKTLATNSEISFASTDSRSIVGELWPEGPPEDTE